MKRCPHCKETLDESMFGKDRSNHDGLQGHCKACRKAMNAERGGTLYHPYTVEEQLYRFPELSLEVMSGSRLSKIWGVSKGLANEIKTNPDWLYLEGDLAGQRYLTYERKEQLRKYLEGRLAEETRKLELVTT